MCIAIYKDKDLTISKETLQQCFKSNPDGAGFMYAQDKELHIQKGFFTFDEFYDAYQQHEKKRAVIHFRIKTHGKIDKANCHPFHIHKGLGFVHNGIISGFGNQEVSDTREFSEGILKPLVSKWGNLAIFQPAIKSLVENRIGYSKLIFLDRHGNAEIFNEQKGVWDQGVWYSNSSYKKPPPLPPVEKKMYPVNYNAHNQIYKHKKSQDYLSIGDLVELKTSIMDQATQKLFYSGEVMEVVAVNNDFTCDLMTEDITDANSKGGFLYNVPFGKLDFWSLDEKRMKPIYPSFKQHDIWEY